MTTPEDTVTTGHAQVAALQQRLRQLAGLLSEYAELADRTDNADLTALVFQARLVLSDDHAEHRCPTVTPADCPTMPR